MSNSKLLFVVITVISLCFLFSACGSDAKEKELTSSVTAVEPTTKETEGDITVVTTTTVEETTAQIVSETTKVVNYTDYSQYIGNSYNSIIEEFGKEFTTQDCVSTMLCKFDDIGFHFDNLDEDNNKKIVRMVRVYGNKYVSEALSADMTYLELKKAVADKTKVSPPEKYSDTEYSVQIDFKGINYNFMYKGNPAKSNISAMYVDISK